jgi:hypothetical protein
MKEGDPGMSPHKRPQRKSVGAGVAEVVMAVKANVGEDLPKCKSTGSVLRQTMMERED